MHGCVLVLRSKLLYILIFIGMVGLYERESIDSSCCLFFGLFLKYCDHASTTSSALNASVFADHEITIAVMLSILRF